MPLRGAKPDSLDFDNNSQTKLEIARAELEEARAAQKLEADNRRAKAHAQLQEARAELEEALRKEEALQKEEALEKARALQKLEYDNRRKAHAKLEKERAELEEARAAQKLDAVTRAENVQAKLEEALRAKHLQTEREEAQAKLEQRVHAELEKARAAQKLEAKSKPPKLVAAEDRRAQRGALLAAHAGRCWTGVLEDVPELDNHAERASAEPAHLPVPNPPAIVFKQNPSKFEAVPSSPANLAAEVQSVNLERKVENSQYSADSVFSEESPQSITTDFLTPTRTAAKAKSEVADLIDWASPTPTNMDEERSLCARLESFVTSMLELSSSYTPYEDSLLTKSEKRTRCRCVC